MKGSDRRERSFDTAESETLGMCGNSMRENREAPQTPTHEGGGRSKEAKSRNVDMHVCGESDGLIVPTKRANKADAYAFGGGVRRGKEVDQGERTTSALAPDPEPGMRVTGVVAHTASRIPTSGWPLQEPEERAEGGNPSPRGPCGGPLARGVPTATDGRKPSYAARIELNLTVQDATVASISSILR